MFPYFWGGVPINDPVGVNMGMLPRLDPDLRDLPEEVREALEASRDELHSAADIRSMTEDLMLRR